MRVTTKGQVTIPKHIRDRLGVRSGSQVRFIERADGAVELVGANEPDDSKEALRRSMQAWLQRVAGSGDAGLTTDQIMDMTRGEVERDGDDR